MVIRVQGASEVQNGIYYEYDTDIPPLGQGGMGVVYDGRCFKVDNPNVYIPVAIKKITATSHELVQRAIWEASIQIQHPNILRMFGFIPNMELDPYTNAPVTHYYVVMERIIGVDLYSVMHGQTYDKSGVHIEYANQIRNLYLYNRNRFVDVIMTSALNAIYALHSNAYIHRDIDPSNIMITYQNEIKLIDFGICKTISDSADDGHKLTKAGAMIGKPDYAAPELIVGDTANHNETSDIYALGIMLYELYTGELPFSGSTSEVTQAHLTKQLPLDKVADNLLRDVIDKATKKEQGSRYQTVEEMIQDFEAWKETISLGELSDSHQPFSPIGMDEPVESVDYDIHPLEEQHEMEYSSSRNGSGKIIFACILGVILGFLFALLLML